MGLFKKCDICRDSLGLFSGGYAVKDGFVCDQCFLKSGIRLRRIDARVADIKSCLFGDTNTPRAKQANQSYRQPPPQTYNSYQPAPQKRIPNPYAIAESKEKLASYVVFDLETTGLNQRKNEIIEIGAVKVENGVVTGTFNTFVKPRKPIEEEVTAINHITKEMLSQAPSINRVLPQFLEFIGKLPLVAHNAEFDCSFIDVACARFGLKFTNKYVDTLELAQEALPELPNHKLGTLCARFGVTNDAAHRALSDCTATQQILVRLIDMAPAVLHGIKHEKNVKQYDNRLSEETRNITELIEILKETVKKKTVEDRDRYCIVKWLGEHEDRKDEFPASRLPAILEMSDRAEQCRELQKLIKITPTGKIKGDIDISGKTVCLSGEFREGSFEEVSQILEAKGAIVKNNVVKKTDYFIVGGFGSPDWCFGSYGRNYKKMMEQIDGGSSAVVILEKDFFKALK